jgi:hypothetical protein
LKASSRSLISILFSLLFPSQIELGGRTQLKQWEVLEFITINPFPGSRSDAGLFVRTNPHQLCLEIGFAAIELR